MLVAVIDGKPAPPSLISVTQTQDFISNLLGAAKGTPHKYIDILNIHIHTHIYIYIYINYL